LGRISAIHAIHSIEQAARVSLGSLYFSFSIHVTSIHKALFVSFRVQSELTSSPTFLQVQEKEEGKIHCGGYLLQEQSNLITLSLPPIVRKRKKGVAITQHRIRLF
jgi:hypothetical protein